MLEHFSLGIRRDRHDEVSGEKPFAVRLSMRAMNVAPTQVRGDLASICYDTCPAAWISHAEFFCLKCRVA